MAIKQQNKADLATVVKKLTNMSIDPHAIFIFKSNVCMNTNVNI